MIRTVLHTYNNTNFLKVKTLRSTLLEYQNVKQFYIDYYWKLYVENPSSNLFIPDYLPYNVLNQNTKDIIAPNLTCRACNSAIDEVVGILKSVLNKKAKLLYAITKQKENNIELKALDLPEKDLTKLQELYDKIKLSKPLLDFEKTSAEISTKCLEIIYSSTNNQKEQLNQQEKIDTILGKIRKKTTKSLINSYRIEKNKLQKLTQNNFTHFNLFIKVNLTNHPILIPVKFNKQDLKFLKTGKLLNGIEFRNNSFDLRYEIPDIKKKTEGRIVGADTGLKTIVTLSDGQVTKDVNSHNKSFSDILDDLSKAKKGSKRFKRLQKQRDNLIKEVINGLDFSDIKQINLEHVSNIFYGNRVSRKMSHWVNSVIEKKILEKGEAEGVLIKLQSSVYYSQRCHCCGLVKKSNRKGKLYCCSNSGCNNFGIEIDADLNSAINHEQELFELPFGFFRFKYNIDGFYWLFNKVCDIMFNEIVILEYNDAK